MPNHILEHFLSSSLAKIIINVSFFRTVKSHKQNIKTKNESTVFDMKKAHRLKEGDNAFTYSSRPGKEG